MSKQNEAQIYDIGRKQIAKKAKTEYFEFQLRNTAESSSWNLAKVERNAR